MESSVTDEHGVCSAWSGVAVKLITNHHADSGVILFLFDLGIFFDFANESDTLRSRTCISISYSFGLCKG